MKHSFHPNPIMKIVKIFVLALLLTAVALVFQQDIPRIFLTLVILIWGVAVIYMAIAYARAKFEQITLEENAARYTIGILSQTNVVLPYIKITETRYNQTLAQKIFGVGDLHLDSAGGATTAIHMLDANKTDVERILKEINKNLSKKTEKEEHE